MGDAVAVVSWKTARMTRADCSLLGPGAWLNDAVIGFWLEYLSSAPHPDGLDRTDVCFIDPAAAFWIATEDDPEDLQDGLDPLELSSKAIVVAPVNDRTERAGNSGSHWALLAIRRLDSGELRSEYYDSMGTSNLSQATELAQKLLPAMGGTGGQDVRPAVCEAGKQDNQSDCGVFALLFAEAIARGGDVATVGPRDAARLRQRIQDTVQKLAAGKG
eukprot:TRINITY_DN67118_c0_g1_i1.p1 TRINITY_DN67118_c0_g1~~TRINITY_DN67118_c0_g1_i1.p1  ORF type:complete len:233 (-),score=48.43 TRINITY_DN67118_c0_g1_i1:52-702(-)